MTHVHDWKGCRSAILNRINLKIESILLISVAHNLTTYHENRLKTFTVIFVTNKLTDGHWRKQYLLSGGNE